MTQEEILEYNKRCAEFLGVRPQHFGPSEEYEMYGVIQCIDDGSDEKHFFMIDELLFHSDWNWIMEMVVSIENKGFYVYISTYTCTISDVGEGKFDDIEIYLYNNKKEATTQTINQFLIWYNDNTRD